MVNPHVSSLERRDKKGHKRNERPCVLQHEAMHTLIHPAVWTCLPTWRKATLQAVFAQSYAYQCPRGLWSVTLSPHAVSTTRVIFVYLWSGLQAQVIQNRSPTLREKALDYQKEEERVEGWDGEVEMEWKCGWGGLDSESCKSALSW